MFRNSRNAPFYIDFTICPPLIEITACGKAAARPRILSPKTYPGSVAPRCYNGHGDDTLLGGCPIPYIVTAASAAAPSLDGRLDQPLGHAISFIVALPAI